MSQFWYKRWHFSGFASQLFSVIITEIFQLQSKCMCCMCACREYTLRLATGWLDLGTQSCSSFASIGLLDSATPNHILTEESSKRLNHRIICIFKFLLRSTILCKNIKCYKANTKFQKNQVYQRQVSFFHIN